MARDGEACFSTSGGNRFLIVVYIIDTPPSEYICDYLSHPDEVDLEVESWQLGFFYLVEMFCLEMGTNKKKSRYSSKTNNLFNIQHCILINSGDP